MVHFFADERSVRGFLRSRSHPWKSPRTGASERSEVAPGPGKAKVTSAGAPAGRTGAGANRPAGRPRNAAPTGDCNREGGRGNNGVAAVHKAGEERRLGATPATATLLPSSWKARDSARPSEARSRLERDVMGREKPEGRGRHREARVCRRVDLVLCCNGNNQA